VLWYRIAFETSEDVVSKVQLAELEMKLQSSEWEISNMAIRLCIAD
jgi:hypothetical protein